MSSLQRAATGSGPGIDLAVRDLRIDRGGTTILDDVSFSIPAGSTLAIVGTNGSGKSTLLRGLVGVSPPASGEVDIGGLIRSAGPRAARRWARRRAHEMAFVSQEELPAAELSVAEAVSLGRTPHRKPWAGHDPGEHDAVAAALHAVGLTELGGMSCARLSGGQRHRVVIARALAQDTPLILLDEPTNHLDPVWRLRLLEALRASGRTVLFSLHELDMVMQYADNVAVLHEGTVHAFGPPGEVFTPELVREVFAVDSAVVRRPGLADGPGPEPPAGSAASPEHLVLWHRENSDAGADAGVASNSDSAADIDEGPEKGRPS